MKNHPLYGNWKRALFATVFSTSFAYMAIAAPISPQEARDEAAEFLSSSSSSIRKMAPASSVLTLGYTKTDKNGTPLFYIFNDSEGSVIVAADDKFPAILGYTDSGVFEESRIPENMKNWLDGYASQIEYFLPKLPDGYGQISNPLKAKRSPIVPMLTTKWNQDEPYNLLCPVDKYGRAVTGCVATAYAQIMKFHQWPRKPVGSNGGVDFEGTTYNWRSMLDDYSQGSYTSSQATAVATLMRQCGAAVNMKYSAWSSGAFTYDVTTALTKYFQYDPSLTMLFKDYIPQSDWNNIVYEELAAGRPIYYSGHSNEGGHAFVCDGYSDNEYFHFNWGWGGYQDGYFLLSALNPAGGGIGSNEAGYTFNQTIIIGIKPGTDSSMPTQQGLLCSGGIYYASNNTLEVRNGSIGDVIYNPFGYVQKVELGIKITPENGGNPIYKSCSDPIDLEPSYGFTAIYLESLPSLTNGKYNITIVYRLPEQSQTWIDVPIPMGRQDHVELEMRNGNPAYTNPGVNETTAAHLLFGKPEFAPSIAAGLPVSFKISVVNVGQQDYSDELGVTLMDKYNEFGASYSDISRFLIPAGSSKEIEYTFNESVPAGTYTLSINDMTENMYLSDYEVKVTDRDYEKPSSSYSFSDLSPNFFTSGADTPFYMTVNNESAQLQKMGIYLELLDGTSLTKIKDISEVYYYEIPANYSGRLHFPPIALNVEPGYYYYRAVGTDGKILSNPTPMIVESGVMTEGGISYIITSKKDAQCVVVAPSNEPYEGSVTIPETIGGMKVTDIRNNAFTFSGITDITIPGGVTELYPGTFYSATSLRNFISNASSVIPYQNDVFPKYNLENIWLNVSQSLIENWHSQEGWNIMLTPLWMISTDNVNIVSGLNLNPATGKPYSPYRMNFNTPLSLQLSASNAPNVEVMVIVNEECILHKVLNPATETLVIPAIGLNTVGEIRLKATTDPVGVESVMEDGAAVLQDVYSIDGKIILRKALPSDIKNLPSGLYITGGRKIIIR